MRSSFLATAIVAAELAVMFVGATLPTPLYPLYRRAFGFSEIMLTFIYATYVLGNMAALFVFGRLSDQIGRRNTTLPAIATGFASTLAFVFAAGTAWLFVARILSGFATGLAAGAATAWVAELQGGDKAVGARIATAANFVGLAVGPLLAGLLAQFAPGPLRVSFLVYVVMLLAIGIAVLYPRETVKSTVRRFQDLSLRPRLAVPKQIRLQFLSPAVTAFVTFALIGFYAALIPNLLADALHAPAPAISGVVVFVLFAVSTLTVMMTARLSSQTATLSGLAVLVPSAACLLAAEVARSMPILLFATVLGGVSAALGYRGSLEVVNRIAPEERRAEVVSGYLVAVYAGNSLPVIGIGLLSALAGSITAHAAFAGVIEVLAAIALVTGLKFAPVR